MIVDREGGFRAIPDLSSLVASLQAVLQLEITIYRESDNLEFEEMVEIFAGCHVLIGTHGRELDNLIFMPENAAVVEVVSRGYLRKAVERLAAVTAVSYFSITVGGTWESIEPVPPKLLLSALGEAIAAVASGSKRVQTNNFVEKTPVK